MQKVGENASVSDPRIRPASAGGGRQTVSGQDGEALAWANANPNDPRSAAIKAKLGVK
jgi:hypothetical protein